MKNKNNQKSTVTIQKQTSWTKLKNNPSKMLAYQKWRRQYNLKKKQREASEKKMIFNNIVYKNFLDLLLRADLQDQDIVYFWKKLKRYATKES